MSPRRGNMYDPPPPPPPTLPADWWHFNQPDYECHQSAFWRLPCRLFSVDGLGARLWQEAGPVASAVLPVLAYHAHSVRLTDGWTPAFGLNERRLALLAGVGRGSIAQAVSGLEALGLVRRTLERRRGIAHARYTVAAACFPIGSEPWRRVPGSYFYGRLHAYHAHHATRWAFFAVFARDAVADEDAVRGAAHARGDDVAEENRQLASIREERPVRASHVADASGLSGRHAERALALLGTLADGDRVPLVGHTPTTGYFVNYRTLDSYYPPARANEMAAERRRARRPTRGAA
ncbi:MAG: hypothetical protein ACK6AH_10105 [Gemmatimonadota bacterium]